MYINIIFLKGLVEHKNIKSLFEVPSTLRIKAYFEDINWSTKKKRFLLHSEFKKKTSLQFIQHSNKNSELLTSK